MAILLIVLVPLMDSFARGVAGFKSAELFTFAQNLAEFQAEDLKSMAPSVLSQLVEGKYPGVYMDDGITPDTSNPLVEYTNYPYPAGYTPSADSYQYDSGNIATEFNLIGLTKIGYFPYVAGPSRAPVLPAADPMLGPNIEILPYEDVDYVSTQWRYYRAVLHKEAYPLFSKHIQVTRYDANSLPDKTHHGSAGDLSNLFDYTITVNTHQSDGSLRVLYVTQGTIGSSFKPTPTTVTVTAPLAGASWSNSAPGTVTWTVSDITGVFAYNVRFSTDNGVTYGSPVAVVEATPSLTVSKDVNPGIQNAQCMVMVEAVSAKGQVLGSDTSDTFTIGTPGGLVVMVQQPTAESVWTTGQQQTVSWSTPAWMTVDQILVDLSTDAGDSYGSAVTLPGDATSMTLTPTVASVDCVVRVTAQGAGGTAIAGGVATSLGTFTTQIPLVITVTAPTTGSIWTTNSPITVTWYPSGSVSGITSYSIAFLSGAAGSPVTAVASPKSITPTSAFEYCVVRVTALNGSNILAYGDSAAFKVRDPFSVTVTAPQGGSSQKKNKSMTVNWGVNRDDVSVANFRVSLSVNNGTTYTVKDTVGGDVYTTSFTLPDVDPQCIVKVEALGVAPGLPQTALSGVFQITNSG
jgi:hypothetical protein